MPSVKQWKAKKWFQRALACEEPGGLINILYYMGNYTHDSVFGAHETVNAQYIPKTIKHVIWQSHLQHEDITNCIRAAFELGYIEQAMECQRLWDGRNNES